MMQPFSGTPHQWNALVAGLPNAHLLQTWEWAQVKAANGWRPMPFVWDAGLSKPVAAAMVLKRQVLNKGFAARLCILYVPKGPLLDPADMPLQKQVLDDLQALARKQGAILLKIDPDVELGRGVPGEESAREDGHGQQLRSALESRGWLFSSDQIQFRNTVLIDLALSEEEMLTRMKQKTRYNVRLALKKSVVVRAGTRADLPMLYRMYAETSVRDGFVIRDEVYYRKVWETFMQPWAGPEQPSAEPLVAEVDGEPVAAIFAFYFGKRAFYIHGMSRDAHRERMPNYLLQWEAMKRARSRGCTTYDLWGAPDDFNEADSMWGVFRFKEGLGGEVVRTLGAWDFPASRFWYKVYAQIVPRVLNVMRARGKTRTERTLD